VNKIAVEFLTNFSGGEINAKTLPLIAPASQTFQWFPSKLGIKRKASIAAWYANAANKPLCNEKIPSFLTRVISEKWLQRLLIPQRVVVFTLITSKGFVSVTATHARWILQTFNLLLLKIYLESKPTKIFMTLDRFKFLRLYHLAKWRNLMLLWSADPNIESNKTKMLPEC
jgi:hypothetical protein